MLRITGATDSYLAALHTTEWRHAFRPSHGVALDVTAPAFVNAGRWLVQCPWCDSAQLTRPGVDRFLCVECANNTVGNAWIQVDWPDDPGAIETELGKRPAPRHMNWRPGETVDDLRDENSERGIV